MMDSDAFVRGGDIAFRLRGEQGVIRAPFCHQGLKGADSCDFAVFYNNDFVFSTPKRGNFQQKMAILSRILHNGVSRRRIV